MEQQRVWTNTAILNWTTDYLRQHGDEHPRLSAEWLLCDATGMSRVELYTNYDRPLEPSELARMHDLVVRRAKGEPLQYVTGEMPFRHIVLRCEPGVLIPRPETEILVDAALEGIDSALAAKKSHGAQPDAAGCTVLEVGVGTGCISLSLAAERPGTRVIATDISPRAIELARRNVDALNKSDAVELVECDLASGVDPELMGSFSVLVSNPPYIPTEVLEHEVGAEVRDFEPTLALDGGSDGLDIYRRLLDLAPAALAPGGMFCVELYEGALDAAADLLRQRPGWDEPEIRQDLTGRPRILVARRTSSLLLAV